jgi:hypothetical protein
MLHTSGKPRPGRQGRCKLCRPVDLWTVLPSRRERVRQKVWLAKSISNLQPVDSQPITALLLSDGNLLHYETKNAYADLALVRFPAMRKQLPDGNSKCMCEFSDVVQGYIPERALDSTHVCSVQIRFFSQALL